MEGLYQEIGSRIRKERKAQGFTQSDLAECIGLARCASSMSDIERGVNHVSIQLLYAIAETLGKSIHCFLPPERKNEEKTMNPEDREALGKVVRETWVKWAKEQPDPKPSWLVPWEQLGERDKEVDRRIGEAVAGAFIDGLHPRVKGLLLAEYANIVAEATGQVK